MGNNFPGFSTGGAQSPDRLLGQYGISLPTLAQLTGETTPAIAQQGLVAANELVNPTDPSVVAQNNLDSLNARYQAAKANGAGNSTLRSLMLQISAAQNAVNTAKSQGKPLGFNELNLQQLQKYGVPLAEAGQNIQRSNALAGARTNAAQIEGPGAEAAGAATALTRFLNPALAKANDAAASININGLSPGEAAATERGLNQYKTSTGNAGLNNTTNMLSDAINFGGAFNNKVQMAINGGATAGSAMNAAINPVGVALGQPNPVTASNIGAGQFTNSNPTSSAGAANNAFGFGNSLFGNMTSGNNAAISAGASMSNTNSPVTELNNIGANSAAVCCFIFMEAYYGKLPRCVRRGRDRYYNVNPYIATGYRRVAHWLVPMMRENEVIRSIVWHVMVKPITEFLHKPKKGWRKTLTHSWIRLAAWLGNNKWEGDYYYA